MSGWLRLDRRVLWVDLIRSVLSLLPTVVAIGVFGVQPRLSELWPAVAVAVLGVGGAVADLLRWLKTRYRLTPERVEVRTGLLVTRVRQIPRDRIRSVDASAKLLYRLAGLRRVAVGAGSGEPALVVDAVSTATATALRRDLLDRTPPDPAALPGTTPPGAPLPDPPVSAAADRDQVLARFSWTWLVHNIFGIWIYLGAAGILWGLYWLLRGFGLEPVAWIRDTAGVLGPLWTPVVAIVALSLLGVGLMAASFVSENWDFRLLRTGGSLRTTQGLFRTREVNRDLDRVRGAEIAEPLLWRWLGTADTNVVTTGLQVWSMRPATAVLPRGPITTARRVTADILGTEALAAPLTPHPTAALRRRVAWALVVSVLTGAAGAIWWSWLVGVVILPVALGAAVVAYRSLGHAVIDGHLVVRSGLLSRRTVALQGPAVIGWRVRQSMLQRRLGLATLTATTAAGNGSYAAVDLSAAAVPAVAESAAPGLLAPFAAGRATAAHPRGRGADRVAAP